MLCYVYISENIVLLLWPFQYMHAILEFCSIFLFIVVIKLSFVPFIILCVLKYMPCYVFSLHVRESGRSLLQMSKLGLFSREEPR